MTSSTNLETQFLKAPTSLKELTSYLEAKKLPPETISKFEDMIKAEEIRVKAYLDKPENAGFNRNDSILMENNTRGMAAMERIRSQIDAAAKIERDKLATKSLQTSAVAAADSGVNAATVAIIQLRDATAVANNVRLKDTTNITRSAADAIAGLKIAEGAYRTNLTLLADDANLPSLVGSSRSYS